MKIKALVITGYGINCEREMGRACALAGAEVEYLHAQRLFSRECPWDGARLICFPGGFSFGDELGAAKAFANRLIFHEQDLCSRLQAFVDAGNCILGICNGFQLLVKLGLLPGSEGHAQTASLTYNRSNRFECRWVNHHVVTSPCVFTKGVDSLYLPVRHGEGQWIAPSASHCQTVLRYHEQENFNGSAGAVGGVCDPSGRIFGMMAHPEAAVHFTNHPQWTRIRESLRRNNQPVPEYGPGFPLFQNVLLYLKESA